MTTRRRFSGKFKATVALEALCGDKTVQEIAAKHRIHPTQVTTYNSSGGYLRAGRLMNGDGESLFSFHLDQKIGYDVGRVACFGPDGFGTWHAIEVRVA